MKTFLSFLVVVCLLSIPQIGYSGWGWLIYHERSFGGRVIDAETKEPIEGAVVVVQYNTQMLGPTGSHVNPMDVQEALTDKNGEFFLPSLTTFIHPLSIGYDTDPFLIWKPGYKREEIMNSYFFTKVPGTVEDLSVFQIDKGFVTKSVRLGIVELKKVQTMEERRRVKPAPFGDKSDWKKQKQFIRMIREEWEHIYGEPAKGLYEFKEGK